MSKDYKGHLSTGYLSNVTNTVNDKRYVISTVRNARTKEWETSVFKRGFFGVFNSLMSVNAQDEKLARWIHDRVETIIEQRSPTEWGDAKSTLINEDRATVSPSNGMAHSVSSSAVEVADGNEDQSAAESALRKRFRGKMNTKDVLEEKAKLVTHLILPNCDTALEIAAALALTLNNTNADFRLGEGAALQAAAETAAFLLHWVDRQALSFLGSKNRDVFMGALDVCVAGALREKGVKPKDFQELVNKRYEEYSHFQKWMPEKDESPKGTLFWEFGIKVATVLCVGKNALFQAQLTLLLLKNIECWKLNEIMPE